MANRKLLPEPLIDENGEVREITAEDVARFKPFSALPQAEQKVLLKLRATGHGWQGRADEALRSWLARQTAHHA